MDYAPVSKQEYSGEYSGNTVSVLISFQSPSQLNTWISYFSGFPFQEFEIHYLSVSVNLSSFLLSDVISSKYILFSVSLPPFFSCPPCLDYLPPC